MGQVRLLARYHWDYVMSILRPNRRKDKPRDSKYMAFIKSMPCAVCWVGEQSTPTEVAHVGERGLGVKSDDRETIPLCIVHHRTGAAAHHVLGKNFWQFHQVDKTRLLQQYQRMFTNRTC